MKILGIDGCRAGWLGVTHSTRELSWAIAPTIETLLSPPIPARVFVDMPIGLSDSGARDCDFSARRMLGRQFSSSVFPTPVRAALSAQNYPAANALNRAHSGRGLSKQSYFLFPKILELDNWLALSGPNDRRPREAHPEVAFMAIKGEPLQYKKKTKAGFNERLALLDRDYSLQQLGQPSAWRLLFRYLHQAGHHVNIAVDADAALVLTLSWPEQHHG